MRLTIEKLMQPLQYHDGSAARNELLKRAARKVSDPSTTVHLYVDFDTAPDYASPFPGDRPDDDAAACMTTSTTEQATGGFRKSMKPGECGTARGYFAQDVKIQGTNQCVRYKRQT